MRSMPFAAGLALAIVAGCGRSEPTFVVPEAPHQGTIVALPDNLGNVEVVRAAVAGAGSPDHAKLFVYFLDAQSKPMASPPVSATLKPKGRKATTVRFKPVAASDPAQAGALESDSFATDGEVAGELTATIGTRPVTVLINLR